MFGKDSISSSRFLKMAVALAAFIGSERIGSPTRADEPEKAVKPQTRSEPAIPIFVNALADLSAILERLNQPDFVILRGDEYNRLLGKDKGSSAAVPPKLPAIVESISASGYLRDEVVEFLIDYVISKASDEPRWVPIRLDGMTLSGAKEEGRDLPLRVENGVWEVELSAKGRHLVKVRFFQKIRQSAEGNRVEFAIPEAASTRLLLEVPRRVTEASAGAGELLTKEFLSATSRTRLSADLVPRSVLGILWINEEEAVAQLPPLLVTQAEMAMDIDVGSLRVRSSWAIRSARGVAKSLEVILNPDDEVLELELDGQSPPAGIERGSSATRLTIPLTEPLDPGRERKLTLTTRRPISSQAIAEVSFKGYPIANAREQSGVIGIVQSGNLGVSAVPGRGIRQIDPRTELPLTLRARPTTALAYQFSEQPFDLNLRIEPSLPLVRSESRTTVTLRPDLASVDTWLDFQAARGRLFEVNLSVPAALKIDSIGPEDVVRTWQAGSLPSSLMSGGPSGGVQLITVKLAGKIQEGGRFSIQVQGKKALDHLGHVGIAVVEPVGTISGGGRVVVLTSPSLSAELDEPQGPAARPSVFRTTSQPPPADWPWPSGKAPLTQPMLWLRHDLNPAELPLKLTFHPKILLETTELNVQIGPSLIDVRQDTECQPRFGSFDALEVLVPEALEGRWSVDGAEIDTRSDAAPSKEGDRLVRLKLLSEQSRSIRLQFQYQLPIPDGFNDEASFETSIPLIRLVGTSPDSKPPIAKINCDPGLRVEAVGRSWALERGTAEGASNVANGVDLPLASHQWDTKSLTLKIQRKILAALPLAVVSRHLIQTVEDSRGELLHRAKYWVERHDGFLPVRLPGKSRLSLAKVAGESINQVEQLSGSRGLRIRFPAKVGRDPVLVELEYATATGEVADMAPPALLDGGIILQTYWEVSLPWNQAVVGTPRGWGDENEWFWDLYVWKRRPRISTVDLAAWVSGNSLNSTNKEPVQAAAHRYLFGTSGPPARLDLRIASRALLVGICSGTVLIVGGLLIVVWLPSSRIAALGVVIALFVAALFFDPSVVFLAVQSGYVGLILIILLTLMKRVVERRNPESSSQVSDPKAVAIPLGSTVSRTVGVGSDDSTAIRARPAEIPESSTNRSAVAGFKPPEPRDEDLTKRTMRSLG